MLRNLTQAEHVRLSQLTLWALIQKDLTQREREEREQLRVRFVAQREEALHA